MHMKPINIFSILSKSNANFICLGLDITLPPCTSADNSSCAPDYGCGIDLCNCDGSKGHCQQSDICYERDASSGFAGGICSRIDECYNCDCMLGAKKPDSEGCANDFCVVRDPDANPGCGGTNPAIADAEWIN